MPVLESHYKMCNPSRVTAWRVSAYELLSMGSADILISFFGNSASSWLHAARLHADGLFNAVAVVALTAAVAVITRFVTAMDARNAFMDRLFENAPPAVILSADGSVSRINGEFTNLFGYSREEAVGRKLLDLIVPTEAADEFQNQLATAVRQRADGESVRRRKNGRPIHVLATTAPVPGPAGRVSLLEVYRDITKRKETETELQRLSVRLMEVQEEERSHLSRELHDEIGQLLTGLRLILRPMPLTTGKSFESRLKEGRDVVDQLLSSVRSLSFDLRPADLDLLGLFPAAQSFCERYTEKTGISVDFRYDGPEFRLSSDSETAAYRIMQESLTNVARHGGVEQVEVRMWSDSQVLNLSITDQGAGFDPEQVMKTPRSSGLIGMRERATALGGSLTIQSAPGRGTTVSAQMLLSRRESTESSEAGYEKYDVMQVPSPGGKRGDFDCAG